jgi:hypothetical protein
MLARDARGVAIRDVDGMAGLADDVEDVVCEVTWEAEGNAGLTNGAEEVSRLGCEGLDGASRSSLSEALDCWFRSETTGSERPDPEKGDFWILSEVVRFAGPR